MNDGGTLLAAEGLHVRFGNAEALRDVHIDVRRGEIHAFLGPNGAGKTTTLRVLVDLQRADAGSVHVFGVPLDHVDGAWRGRIGWLRGETALFPFMRAEAVLDFLHDLSGARDSRRRELLDLFGLSAEVLRRRVSTLSSGMRQAVAIVAALQHDPELLLLDEPTNALDPIVRGRFLAHLRALRAEGKGILLSSHVLDEVEEVADRITLIHRGAVLMATSLRELAERLPRKVRVLLASGMTREWLAPRADAALLRELAALDPAAVSIEDAGLEELFRSLGERAP